jgi:DNA adenine methylase
MAPGLVTKIPYPGGKLASGNIQAIINQIPPHRTYLEIFAGGAAVFFHKRRAEWSHLCELESGQASRLAMLARESEGVGRGGWTVHHVDALDYASSYAWRGDEFVYADPPYPMSTKGGRLYKIEMADERHQQLLQLLAGLPCKFALSGYRCPMYDAAADAHGWRRLDYQSMSHGGVRTESLWMNYPEPVELHDYSYVGANFTDRQRIKRKADRWVSMLDAMPPLERGLVLSKINASYGLDKS